MVNSNDLYLEVLSLLLKLDISHNNLAGRNALLNDTSILTKKYPCLARLAKFFDP